MAQLLFRRKRTSGGKQTQAPRIPFSPLPRRLLEIPPDRNHDGRHQSLVVQSRQLQRGRNPTQENVPTFEGCVRQSSSGRGCRQIARNHESPSSAQIATSTDSASHGGRAAKHICGNAQNNTNSRVARSNTRPTHRRGGVTASPRLEPEKHKPSASAIQPTKTAA